MSIDISTIISQNITIAYDALDPSSVDVNRLKGLFSSKSVMMDTPEMTVIVSPSEQLFIQLADKRIRLTLQKETEKLGEIPLWKLARSCHQLISKKSNIIAYGFNYDVGILTPDRNAQVAIRDLFISDLQAIEEALQGSIFSFIPRFKLKKNNTEYDLLIEPLNKEAIKAHLNVHFEAKKLPSQNNLQASFFQEYKYFISILPKLLEKR